MRDNKGRSEQRGTGSCLLSVFFTKQPIFFLDPTVVGHPAVLDIVNNILDPGNEIPVHQYSI
jgi:hypothetical protein